MAKVTSKLQVTVPRKIADEFGIQPGDDLDWMAAGEVIRVIPTGRQAQPTSRESQLHWFDQATVRHSKRSEAHAVPQPSDRGWKREDLYERGRSR